MADTSEGTPPPTVNTRRPDLRERAARRYRNQSVGFRGFLGFLSRAVTLVLVVFAGFYVYRHSFVKGIEPATAIDAGAPGPHTTGNVPEPGRTAPVPSPVGSAVREDLTAFERRMEFETAQGVQRQKLALAKLKQRQVIDLGGSVVKVLDDWKAELGKWEGEVLPLLEEDKGKQLAANKPLLKRFRAVYDSERPGKDEEERLRSLADGVTSAAKLAGDNPSDGSLPSEAVATELQGLLRQAKDGRDKYRTGREQISALVRQAKSGPPGTQTLAEASSVQREEERFAAAEVVEAERARSEEAATARIAKVKAAQARELGLKEEERLRAQTRVLKAEADNNRIRRLAEDPRTQAQFAAFLADGKYQYNLGAFGDLPEPASYAALEQNGHLKDATRFAHAMAGHSFFGSGIYRVENDRRPLWPFPTGPAGMRQMEQLLTQFKELAPTWIMMEKLRP